MRNIKLRVSRSKCVSNISYGFGLQSYLLGKLNRLGIIRIDTEASTTTYPFTGGSKSLIMDRLILIRIPRNQMLIQRSDLILHVLGELHKVVEISGSQIEVTRVVRRTNAFSMLQRRVLTFVRTRLVGFNLFTNNVLRT